MMNFAKMNKLLIEVNKACKTETPNSNAAKALQDMFDSVEDKYRNQDLEILDSVEFTLIQYYESLGME